MGKPIRVGLIGLGRAGYGMHRIELGRRPDKFQFVAVCDEIEERTKAFADEFGSRTYTRVEDLIADPEVEMVTVATRSCDHYRHAVMALEAGKDVLIEKPFGIRLEQAQRLIELGSQPAGPHIYMRHNRRFERGFELVNQIIDSGKLGEVYEIRLARNEYNRRYDWQTLLEYAGGHLFNWGSHIIDHALRFCGGDYKDLYTNIKHVVAAGNCEDHAKLVFTGINNRIVDMEISYGVALPTPEYIVYGTRGTMVGGGRNLHLRYLDPDHLPEPIEADRETPPAGCDALNPGSARVSRNPEVLVWKEEDVAIDFNGTERMWDALYDAIRNGVPYPVTLEQAAKVIEVIDKAKAGTVFENVEFDL